jgi:hypothetical protein
MQPNSQINSEKIKNNFAPRAMVVFNKDASLMIPTTKKNDITARVATNAHLKKTKRALPNLFKEIPSIPCWPLLLAQVVLSLFLPWIYLAPLIGLEKILSSAII